MCTPNTAGSVRVSQPAPLTRLTRLTRPLFSCSFCQADFAANTELGFTILFTIEFVAKAIAWGFVMHKGSYLR